MTAFGILGPLSVAGAAVTASRDRVVLAMLLLHADRVLGAAELIDAVWGEQPPSTARGQLQACVSRLRRALPAGAIETGPAGYRLRCAADDLDAGLFTRLVAEARERRDPQLFRRALDLWRGPALAEIDSVLVRRAAAVLDEQRMAATEEWAGLELAAGHERDLLDELAGLVERYPLRERLRGQLMVALYRSGRPAEALAEYQRTRQMLCDELGLDPGRELQELHRQIRAGGPAGEGPPERVRCLPRTVGDFTGREAAVARLIGAIDAADPRGPAIVVIDGMAGSGKTTLALHLAGLVGDRYPDAHLFVDLHGHSAEQPLEPAAALLILLRQLGVTADRIPPALVDRVSLWRTELAGRRSLVLLDNAASSSQLADLLPTSPGNLALVTGRRRLPGLDAVHPESLPVLTSGEAIELLARIVGARVVAEAEAAEEVVRRCGGLPLALRLAGARLAHRPRWQVADLVHRLGRSALPELAAEDRSVADAFAMSYAQLREPVRRAFRLLGVHPGADFDALVVAALTGLSLDEAADVLDDLVDVHLIEEPEPDVYRLHDLLREFAAALAAAAGPDGCRAALHGVLDLQLHAAAATCKPDAYRAALDRDILAPAPLRPDLLSALTDPERRIERERRNLPAYVDAADDAGLHEYAWMIPRAAWRALWVRGDLDSVAVLFRRALAVAERIEDLSAVAVSANLLASAHGRRSELDEACRLIERSVQIREKLGQWAAATTAMVNLAAMHHAAGRWAKSLALADEVRRATALRRVGGGFGTYLDSLGKAHHSLGHYPEALRYFRLRLLVMIELGDLTQVADCLIILASIKYRTGAVGVAAARRQIGVALRLCERESYTYGEGDAHSELGVLFCAEGRFEEAAAAHRRAVDIATRQYEPLQESRFRHDFGMTLRAAGDLPAAREMFEEAMRLAERARLPYLIAKARTGLGDCLAATEPAEARRLWELARAAYADLDAPELAEVEARLRGEDQLRPAADGGTMVR